MEDKLDIMFENQKKLQIEIGHLPSIVTEADKQQYINQMILAIVEETVEIMRETKYKNPDCVKYGWKKNQQWNLENYKEEIIDLFHYVMNLCIVVGMDADEFFKIYLKKNKINFERSKNGY